MYHKLVAQNPEDPFESPARRLAMEKINKFLESHQAQSPEDRWQWGKLDRFISRTNKFVKKNIIADCLMEMFYQETLSPKERWTIFLLLVSFATPSSEKKANPSRVKTRQFIEDLFLSREELIDLIPYNLVDDGTDDLYERLDPLFTWFEHYSRHFLGTEENVDQKYGGWHTDFGYMIMSGEYFPPYTGDGDVCDYYCDFATMLSAATDFIDQPIITPPNGEFFNSIMDPRAHPVFYLFMDGKTRPFTFDQLDHLSSRKIYFDLYEMTLNYFIFRQKWNSIKENLLNKYVSQWISRWKTEEYVQKMMQKFQVDTRPPRGNTTLEEWEMFRKHMNGMLTDLLTKASEWEATMSITVAPESSRSQYEKFRKVLRETIKKQQMVFFDIIKEANRCIREFEITQELIESYCERGKILCQELLKHYNQIFGTNFSADLVDIIPIDSGELGTIYYGSFSFAAMGMSLEPAMRLTISPQLCMELWKPEGIVLEMGDMREGLKWRFGMLPWVFTHEFAHYLSNEKKIFQPNGIDHWNYGEAFEHLASEIAIDKGVFLIFMKSGMPWNKSDTKSGRLMKLLDSFQSAMQVYEQVLNREINSSKMHARRIHLFRFAEVSRQLSDEARKHNLPHNYLMAMDSLNDHFSHLISKYHPTLNNQQPGIDLLNKIWRSITWD